MLDKRGRIKLGLIILIFLVLSVIVLQLQIASSSNEIENFEPFVISKNNPSFEGGGIKISEFNKLKIF